MGMGVGVITIIAYIAYALGSKAPPVDDIRAWALTMLSFIGIAVVAIIITQILFHILYSIGIAIKQHVKEGDESDGKIERLINATIAEDERDKQVSLKAARIGYRIIGMSLLLGLIALGIGVAPLLALHLVLAACAIGCFAEGIASIYYYERGM